MKHDVGLRYLSRLRRAAAVAVYTSRVTGITDD